MTIRTSLILLGHVKQGSTDTFVYTTHPTPLANYPDSILPPLFNNATATGLSDTGMVYSARYGSGNGITETLGHIQFASDVTLSDTSLTVTNLTFASLWESSSSTGSSGLLGLGWPLNSVVSRLSATHVYCWSLTAFVRRSGRLFGKISTTRQAPILRSPSRKTTSPSFRACIKRLRYRKRSSSSSCRS